MRNGILLLVLAPAVVAAAQTQGGSATAVQDNGTQPAVEDDLRAPAPALLNGQAASLEFTPELERSNFLRGGISVGATYDDNATDTTANRVGDFGYSILPHIELDQARPRLHWTVNYFGGFTANQRLTARNQGSHNLTGTLQFRLSPHVDLRLSDAFLATTGLLQQFQNGLGAPATGPINQPNTTLVTPLAKNLNNTGSVDLSYQFSADDMVGVGGTFYDSHFRDLPTGANALTDTSTRSGNFYYNHRFTPRNWTGIVYRYQRLEFSPSGDVTDTQSVLLSHTIYLQPHMTLSFFAGPEYSQLTTASVSMNVTPTVISFAVVSTHDHQLSVSAGGNFGWQGEHTSLHLDADRRVTDGGGLMGSVELTSVGGGIRRQLGRTTALHFSGVYGHNQVLGAAGSGQSALKSATGSTGVEQRLGGNFMLTMDYARDYLKGGTAALANQTVNHNRGYITISYNFTRPIGR
jgi:hypothetical protein